MKQQKTRNHLHRNQRMCFEVYRCLRIIEALKMCVSVRFFVNNNTDIYVTIASADYQDKINNMHSS